MERSIKFILVIKLMLVNGLTNINKMSTDIAFNDEDLNNWVQACTNETRLRNEGASTEVLTAARIAVVTGLVSLIAPSAGTESAAALFTSLLQDAMPITDEDDPIPESVNEHENQSVADDVGSVSSESTNGEAD